MLNRPFKLHHLIAFRAGGCIARRVEADRLIRIGVLAFETPNAPNGNPFVQVGPSTAAPNASANSCLFGRRCCHWDDNLFTIV